jgi:hypothetical protein
MIIKSFIIIVFSSLIFAACCTCGNVNKDEADIPGRLQKKADEFVISKTGKEFFIQYIKINYNKITKIENGYLMVYNFSIPEKEGVEGEVRFSIDTLGNIKKDREIVGIPACLSNSENCNFKISKGEAIDIAKQKGFEKGIKDWDINFIWDPEYEKYTWQIRTTLSETKGAEFNRGSGKVMFVDPNNGSIIKVKYWRIN